MPRRSRLASFGGGRSRVGRRETLWFSGPDETALTIVAAGGVDFQSSLNAAALALRPFTIVRVRGLLVLQSDQEVTDEEPFGAFGHCVVTDQAVAAGVSAIPSPITDQASDVWFTYVFGAAGFHVSALSSNPEQYRVEFDSKAMRKVESGMDVVTVFENASSFGLEYVALWRMLVKLH